MDFSWSAAQISLYDRTLAFARERLAAPARGPEAPPGPAPAQWRLCGEFGLLGLCVPEAYGGMGLDALTTARVVEAFGRGCADTGLVFAAAAHLFACAMPLAEHGAEELRRALLPRLCSGELVGANAITEAEAGSDVFALKARAARDGDGYVLAGTKTFVTNGPVADAFVVYASTEPAHGYLGVSAFVVERGAAGLRAGEPFATLGLESAAIGTLYLDGCRVPAGNRLGDEGAGAAVFKRSMQWERACLFAAYVGVMERQLEQAVAHATTRRQFGRTLGRHQAVAHRVADMKLRLEAARLLLYRACWLMDQGRDAALEVSLAKLAVSEAAVQSGLDAIRVHGGTGVVVGAGVEQGLRDAVPATIFSGTSDIHRELIARALGL